MVTLTFLTQAATRQMHEAALQWTLLVALTCVIRLESDFFGHLLQLQLSKPVADDVAAHSWR